jgi:predicted amidophosphoribosyltransferase
MPDESCRKCGGMLIKATLCAACRDIIQRICIKCGLKTAEQIHNQCLYEVELFQTRIDNRPIASVDLCS